MDGVEGAAVTRLGRARLVAKMCAVMLGVSLAVFGFCAAYVIASGATLLELNAAVLAFFVSLAAAFLSMLGCLIFSVKLRAIDEYDISLALPDWTYVRENSLRPDSMEGTAVQHSSVGTEITVNARCRKLSAFDSTSVVMAVALAAALCTFTTLLGIIAAQNAAAGIGGVVSAMQTPNIVGQVCLAALVVALSVLVINSLRHDLFGQSTKLMVLEDGYSRSFSDREVVSIAEKVNFQPSDITHVRIYRA